MEEENYTDESGYEDHNEVSQEETPAEDNADPESSDQAGIEERIDDLLEQIGAGQSYGSMGDYFIPAVGCYAFPGEDCFYHFISEEERSGWTAASNGCYVPTWSIEVYEAYLTSGQTDEEDEETDGQEEDQLLQPVTQEDLAEIGKTLNAMYQQDAIYYEAVMENNLQRFQDIQEIKGQLTVISIVLIVLCVFLALLCGKGFADTFFERMRAG